MFVVFYAEKLHCFLPNNCTARDIADWFLTPSSNRNISFQHTVSLFNHEIDRNDQRKCYNLTKKELPFDGFIGFFPLNVLSSRHFLDSSFDSSKQQFRFTILREPVQHFIVYHEYLTKVYKNDPLVMIPHLGEIVPLFRNVITKDRQDIQLKHQIIFDLLTNRQAKILGWAGNHERKLVNKSEVLGKTEKNSVGSLESVLEYLDSLNLVGIYEKIERSWDILSKRIGWYKSYRLFFDESLNGESEMKRKRLAYSYAPEFLKKIEEIQYADVALYRRALKIFDKYK